ncbi:hypothetical protein A3J23_01795 [Candidatus Peregrinibacteria bacterium RIFCSPLOWO2_02_FULL_48_14]|nr:MAG: hypothetical protein A2974_03795 [Candidatus Peregrinibacteria bacterium RIFCSPLOWO2_01_FULL_48_20]OGJ45667.1 MAG: hypothetical protein A3J23_01795 [Candidatus Peregrinibacteria bacterium RIFCSPLOWO2_02_FULL_48_14]
MNTKYRKADPKGLLSKNVANGHNIIIDRKMLWSIAIVFSAILLALNVVFEIQLSPRLFAKTEEELEQDLQEAVFSEDGALLPIQWADLGQKMIADGVIDSTQMSQIMEQRGWTDDYSKELLEGTVEGELKLTQENSGLILNLLWAFGLANKNTILETGPMVDPAYGGAGGFASTGGWSVSVGDSMDHYSRHEWIVLTDEQQALVEEVAKNIYRPCCGNSTYFPDCNHGMAMLGFLELMAAQGGSEEEMYEAALVLNSYWFPGTYLTIGKYFAKEGTDWEDIDPKTALSAEFSSSAGYKNILSTVEPSQASGGGSCGV